jgi:hypothetical protein
MFSACAVSDELHPITPAKLPEKQQHLGHRNTGTEVQSSRPTPVKPLRRPTTDRKHLTINKIGVEALVKYKKSMTMRPSHSTTHWGPDNCSRSPSGTCGDSHIYEAHSFTSPLSTGTHNNSTCISQIVSTC